MSRAARWRGLSDDFGKVEQSAHVVEAFDAGVDERPVTAGGFGVHQQEVRIDGGWIVQVDLDDYTGCGIFEPAVLPVQVQVPGRALPADGLRAIPAHTPHHGGSAPQLIDERSGQPPELD